MGFAKTVSNLQDGKPYVISTAKNLWGIWESAVFHRGFLGLPGKPVSCVCPITPDQMLRLSPSDLLMPERTLGKRILFFPVKTISDADVQEIHALVSDIVMESPASEWEGMFTRAVGRYLDDHQLSDKPRQEQGSPEGTVAAVGSPTESSGYKEEVTVGDHRIEVRKELIAFRDLTRYFREKGWSPGDCVHLSAWVSGFMVGSILGGAGLSADSDHGQKLTGLIHQAVSEGIKAGIEGQDADLSRRYFAAGGHYDPPPR